MRTLPLALAIAVSMSAGLPARADHKAQLAALDLARRLVASRDEEVVPKPGFRVTTSSVDDKPERASIDDGLNIDNDPIANVVAMAADGKASWIAFDLAHSTICGMGDCEKMRRDLRKTAAFHATFVLDGGKPLLVHVDDTVTDKDAAARPDATPAEIPAQVDKDAAPVVELLKASLADPKVFAATISDRADVVLYGSDPGERIVGGAAARATWTKWGLSVTAQGGVRAGVTASKTVAWVVTAAFAKAKTDKRATPYTLSAVYEKQGAAWKLVQAHFAFPGY